MFTVTMLPAGVGDAIWIEYGPPTAPKRVLIDCGTPPTWRGTLKDRLAGLGAEADFELLIVTHVDTDHIGGVLPLFAAALPGVTIDQVWFNAWRHLAPESRDLLGPVDGEILTAQLDQSRMAWNRPFRAVDHAVRTPRAGRALPTRRLPGGMRVTVVAPGREELEILRPAWAQVVADAGLVPGRPSRMLVDKARRKGVKLDLLGADPIPTWAAHDPGDLDTTQANGSSIAVLAEYDDEGTTKRCLLAGDAHGPVLCRGVRRLARQRGEDRLRVDVFKLPHHGSLKNVTSDLVRAVDARTCLFSSNGKQHGHPHKEAVARVLVDGSRPSSLKFNYRTENNARWDNSAWKRKYRYETEYGNGTLTVRL